MELALVLLQHLIGRPTPQLPSPGCSSPRSTLPVLNHRHHFQPHRPSLRALYRPCLRAQPPPTPRHSLHLPRQAACRSSQDPGPSPPLTQGSSRAGAVSPQQVHPGHNPAAGSAGLTQGLFFKINQAGILLRSSESKRGDRRQHPAKVSTRMFSAPGFAGGGDPRAGFTGCSCSATRKL